VIRNLDDGLKRHGTSSGVAPQVGKKAGVSHGAISKAKKVKASSPSLAAAVAARAW
jgi:hypothetical protein